MKFFNLLFLFAISFCFLKDPVQAEITSTCNGAFDVYFVLDLSSSLLRGGKNHFKEETVSFVRELVSQFTSPLLRISFITFNAEARVFMALTSDRARVRGQLKRLERATPQGGTRLDLGLLTTNRQIRANRDSRASVVIVLTDANIAESRRKTAFDQSNLTRRLGGTIIAVGVGQFKTDQLLQIAGGLDQFVFQAVSFSGLQDIVQQVLESSCVEITYADPSSVCYNETFEIHVHGRGFNNTGSLRQARCGYLINGEDSYLVTPISRSPTKLVCPSPEEVQIEVGDVIVLEVSLNGGVSFISSNVTISAVFCPTTGAVVGGIFAALLLLLLLLLWWFAKALCCCAAAAAPAKPKPLEESSAELTPPPTPKPVTTVTKQWPAVDCSHYGGGGAGGIKPVKVRWGDRGCTEAGIHLEKSKDAREVAYVSKEVTVDAPPKRPPPPSLSSSSSPSSSSSLCCGLCSKFALCCSPCAAFIGKLALRRPTAADVKKGVFIKPNADENGNQTKSAEV